MSFTPISDFKLPSVAELLELHNIPDPVSYPSANAVVARDRLPPVVSNVAEERAAAANSLLQLATQTRVNPPAAPQSPPFRWSSRAAIHATNSSSHHYLPYPNRQRLEKKLLPDIQTVCSNQDMNSTRLPQITNLERRDSILASQLFSNQTFQSCDSLPPNNGFFTSNFSDEYFNFPQQPPQHGKQSAATESSLCPAIPPRPTKISTNLPLVNSITTSTKSVSPDGSYQVTKRTVTYQPTQPLTNPQWTMEDGINIHEIPQLKRKSVTHKGTANAFFTTQFRLRKSH